MFKAREARILSNWRRSQRQFHMKMKVSAKSVWDALKMNLGLKAIKRRYVSYDEAPHEKNKSQGTTSSSQAVRGKNERIHFTAE